MVARNGQEYIDDTVKHGAATTVADLSYKASSATDQEGLHFCVGSNFHRLNSETRARLRGGGSNVSNAVNATKCVLINTIPILITAVQKQFLFID